MRIHRRGFFASLFGLAVSPVAAKAGISKSAIHRFVPTKQYGINFQWDSTQEIPSPTMRQLFGGPYQFFPTDFGKEN